MGENWGNAKIDMTAIHRKKTSAIINILIHIISYEITVWGKLQSCLCLMYNEESKPCVI